MPGMTKRPASTILYGDPEDPETSLPASAPVGTLREDFGAKVQDILDETTTIAEGDQYYLSGENLAANMSAIAPWCLSTEQMNIVAEADEDWSAGAGWIFNRFTTIDGGLSYHHFAAKGGIVVGKLSVNSVYVDPDQDVTTPLTDLAQYGHSGLPDPTLVPMDGTVDDPYGNALYTGQVYEYDDGEYGALLDKFGYTAGIEGYPAEAYGAAYVRIGMEIDDLIEMLQVGYSARRNIARSTPGVNIFDNFEVISAVENEEPIDESMSGVATSTMVIGTGDYDS